MAEAAGVELWCQDEAGPYQAIPQPGASWQPEGKPAHVTISFPGPTGGTNWGGAAADPKLGYVFVNSQDSPGTGWIRKNPKYGHDR